MAAVLFGGITLFANRNSFSEVPPANLMQTETNSGFPLRLKIPSINIDAPIEHVAETPEGDMDVPKLQFNTAWYKLGSRPGEIGSAVIAGHKDWKNGEKAIFADLHKLKPGGKVVIEDDRGLVTTYVVRTSQTYNPDSDATNVFRSNDGKAHLNLITCQGIWDKKAESYSQRLVVFTDKE